MRCLILPDVHLKPGIFDRADKILASGQADFAIQMGDLVDDWGQEFNVALYDRTMQRVLKFHRDHPNTLWCRGNHDFGYAYPDKGVRESGHSRFQEGIMGTYLREMERIGAKQKVMHLLGGVIFTHAGLTADWACRRFEKVGYAPGVKPSEANLVHIVNHASPEELWQEDSPIWARPQHDEYIMWGDYLHVVGHTPVRHPTQEDDVLSTDLFSTYRDGTPFGDEKFVIIDTTTKDWRIAEERDE